MKQLLILCFSLFLLLTISCNTTKQVKAAQVDKTTVEQPDPSLKKVESSNKVVINSEKSKKQVSAAQLKKIQAAGVKKLPKGTKKEGGN